MAFPSMQRINVSNGFLQSRIDVYLSHYPDSTSLKNLLHWRQVIFPVTELDHMQPGPLLSFLSCQGPLLSALV